MCVLVEYSPADEASNQASGKSDEEAIQQEKWPSYPPLLIRAVFRIEVVRYDFFLDNV